MNRISILKATKKILEMQSGGESPDSALMAKRLNTLKQNALNAGYTEDEIDVKWVTDEEWAVIQADLNKPTPEQLAEQAKEALIQAKMRESAITALKEEGRLTLDGEIVNTK